MTRPMTGFAATLAACMGTAPAVAEDASQGFTAVLDNGLTAPATLNYGTEVGNPLAYEDTSIGGTVGGDLVSYDDTSITGTVGVDVLSAGGDLDVTLSPELDNGIQRPMSAGSLTSGSIARPSVAVPATRNYTFDLGTRK